MGCLGVRGVWGGQIDMANIVTSSVTATVSAPTAPIAPMEPTTTTTSTTTSVPAHTAPLNNNKWIINLSTTPLHQCRKDFWPGT